jgi:hypothetical protein
MGESSHSLLLSPKTVPVNILASDLKNQAWRIRKTRSFENGE